MFVEFHTSPDRGARSALETIGTVLSNHEVWLILTGGRAFSQRVDPDGLIRRKEGWRRIVREAGLDADRVVEIDLDHLTSATRARLQSISRDGSVVIRQERQLERSIRLVREAAEQWAHQVDWPTQVALVQQIDGIYGHEISHPVTHWRKHAAEHLAKVRTLADASRMLGEAAEGVVDRLPPSLRLRPGWVVAGAVTGAVGCLAAALTLAPAAVGVLPLWSGIGAAVAGVISTRATGAGQSPTESVDEHGVSRGAALRAVVLHVIVLELQGRPEPVISRVLGHALPADDTALLDTEATGRWLNEVRHRFDMALASEEQP